MSYKITTMDVGGIGGMFQYNLSEKHKFYLQTNPQDKLIKDKLILVKDFKRVIAIGLLLTDGKLVKENKDLYTAIFNEEDEELFYGIEKEDYANMHYASAEWFNLKTRKEKTLIGMIKLSSIVEQLPNNGSCNSIIGLYVKGLSWYLRSKTRENSM